MPILNAQRNQKSLHMSTSLVYSLLIITLILASSMHQFTLSKKYKEHSKKRSTSHAPHANTKSTLASSVEKTKTVSILNQESKNSHSASKSKKNDNKKNQRNAQMSSSTQKAVKPTLGASEIREESKNSLVNCAGVKDRESYADCVIDNLSLEFFFTAFVYYQRRFKKNYGSVREENRRFQIFMNNYQKILK